MADINDLDPVSRAEFANEMTPCLALTSGVGMTAADQRVWLSAAYRALDGIPIALLKRGCDAAMKTADHPSKIVPTIIKEIRADWDWRKKFAKPTRPALETLEAPTPEISAEERANVSQSMATLLARMAATAPNLETILGGKNGST